MPKSMAMREQIGQASEPNPHAGQGQINISGGLAPQRPSLVGSIVSSYLGGVVLDQDTNKAGGGAGPTAGGGMAAASEGPMAPTGEAAEAGGNPFSNAYSQIKEDVSSLSTRIKGIGGK